MVRLLVPRMKGGRHERQKACHKWSKESSREGWGRSGVGIILSPDIIHVTAAGWERRPSGDISQGTSSCQMQKERYPGKTSKSWESSASGRSPDSTPRQIHPHAGLLSGEGYTTHNPVSLGCPRGTWTGDASMSADQSLLDLAGIYSARRRPGGEGGMIPWGVCSGFLIYPRDERKAQASRQPECQPRRGPWVVHSHSLTGSSTSLAEFHVEDSCVGGTFGLELAGLAEPCSWGTN